MRKQSGKRTASTLRIFLLQLDAAQITFSCSDRFLSEFKFLPLSREADDVRGPVYVNFSFYSGRSPKEGPVQPRLPCLQFPPSSTGRILSFSAFERIVPSAVARVVIGRQFALCFGSVSFVSASHPFLCRPSLTPYYILAISSSAFLRPLHISLAVKLLFVVLFPALFLMRC
jgi:hypothetical protein